MSSHGTPIRVDHVGIAVESIAEAEPVLFALGCEKTHEEPGPDGSFAWATYDFGDASRLELIAPAGDGGFLAEYLDANGPGLHHVTLEVADLDAVVDALEASGARIVDRREHDDWTEAFVSPRNPTGALFQLMEYRDGYAADRGGPERAYVGGERLGAARGGGDR
ncbi:VOC family protein [Halegenticoccus soli]|uniref:VOC family protein n=1 Tax=Halegenticoccus soli TaxID=1985678 RepID=UPI000C6E49DA|nr:VOC family protein [Halegenticoccus soli]